ncbi:MAG: hypothetical protein WC081_06265 [Candidatus Ratteibacteria bacterium]|jgi:hypothetical protein
MKMKINDCAPSIRREVITILERIYDEITPKGDGSFVYYIREDIKLEEEFQNLWLAFRWLIGQKIIRRVRCFRESSLGTGSRFPSGWSPFSNKLNVELFCPVFSPATIGGDLSKIKGVLRIDRKELFETIKSYKETEGGQEGISKSTLCIDKKQDKFKSDGVNLEDVQGKLPEPPDKEKPIYEIENGSGYVRFSKRGKKIKIGGEDIQACKLLKCLFSPAFGTAKSIEAVYDALTCQSTYEEERKKAFDGNDKEADDPYTAKSRMVTTIENAEKEVQKKVSQARKKKLIKSVIKVNIDSSKVWLSLQYKG